MRKVVIICVIVCMMMTVASCACSNNELDDNMSAPTSTAVATNSATPMPTPTVTLAPTPTPKRTPQPTATPGKTEKVKYKDKEITFKYYDVAEEANVEVNYAVDEGDTSPKTVIDAVNAMVLKDILGGKEIKTNSIKFSDGNIFVDFTKDIYNLNLGSAGENAVLDSIADAYLNNVEDIKAVYYLVDGEAYESEHIEGIKGRPYKTK
ncbi:MAG: GerMN domain-containing protein [Christensenellaceae bacterium]